ncbi:hypothetical protein V6U81_10540 [Micromonospora sp. CPCC 205711]|uniref:hypothetical protein n=1 Tax=Micromonospora sp. CPCC 205547 TaxID=3122400 RepID=UPI002FF4081D
MSSGTPVWAVLIVAAFGVLGTLAAAVTTQILSGRREARQWERQRAHERERWDRERDERREQWEREDHARWHQERLPLYTEILKRIEEWDEVVNHVLPRLDPGPAVVSEEDQHLLGAALARVADADRKLSLFASKETDQAASRFFMDAMFCHMQIGAGGLDDPERLKQVRFEVRALADRQSELLTSIRRDLGLPPGLETRKVS